jgi:hypothetical protein
VLRPWQALTQPEFQGKMAIVLAGYADKIDQLLGANQGLARRFSARFVFPDMDAAAVAAAAVAFLKREYGLELTPEAVAAMPVQASRLRGMPKFSNGGTAETLAKEVYRKRALRLLGLPADAPGDRAVTAADLQAAALEVMGTLADVAAGGAIPALGPPITSVEDVVEREGLLGLEDIKQELREIEVAIRAAWEDGVENPVEMNFLFMGKPGTGLLPAFPYCSPQPADGSAACLSHSSKPSSVRLPA